MARYKQAEGVLLFPPNTVHSTRNSTLEYGGISEVPGLAYVHVCTLRSTHAILLFIFFVSFTFCKELKITYMEFSHILTTPLFDSWSCQTLASLKSSTELYAYVETWILVSSSPVPNPQLVFCQQKTLAADIAVAMTGHGPGSLELAALDMC